MLISISNILAMAVALLDRSPGQAHLSELPLQRSLRDRIRIIGGYVLDALNSLGEAAGEVGEAGLDVASQLSTRLNINPFGLLETFDDSLAHPLDIELSELDDCDAVSQV